MGSVPSPVPLRPRPGEDGASVGKFLAGKFLAGKFLAGKFLAGKFPAGKFPAGKFPAGKFQVSRFVPMLSYQCRSSSVCGL